MTAAEGGNALEGVWMGDNLVIIVNDVLYVLAVTCGVKGRRKAMHYYRVGHESYAELS